MSSRWDSIKRGFRGDREGRGPAFGWYCFDFKIPAYDYIRQKGSLSLVDKTIKDVESVISKIESDAARFDATWSEWTNQVYFQIDIFATNTLNPDGTPKWGEGREIGLPAVGRPAEIGIEEGLSRVRSIVEGIYERPTVKRLAGDSDFRAAIVRRIRIRANTQDLSDLDPISRNGAIEYFSRAQESRDRERADALTRSLQERIKREFVEKMARARKIMKERREMAHRIVQDAKDEASKIRDQARRYSERKRSEAEAEAEKILVNAKRRASQIIRRAEARAEEIIREAEESASLMRRASPKRAPKLVPKRAPKSAPKRAPKSAPKRAPKSAPKRTPKPTPKRKKR